jgi:hypothetical protein
MSNIAKTTAAVTIASDATVKVGKQSFTLDQAVKHGMAIYDTMWLAQESMLDCYKQLGELLIGLKALFGDNDKAFGSFLAKSDLGNMSRQDRSDAVFLATNWTKVQKLNKSGALDTLGVSAIRKRLKASEGKASNGAGVRKQDQAPKGEAKAAAVAEPKALKITTEAELAEFVWQAIADNALDFAAFTKALVAKRKGA